MQRRFGGGRKVEGIPNDWDFFEKYDQFDEFDPKRPDLFEYLEPCPVCGGYDFWWNFFYDRFCNKCKPNPKYTERMEAIAATIRAKYPAKAVKKKPAADREPAKKTAAKKPAKKKPAKKVKKKDGGGRKT